MKIKYPLLALFSFIPILFLAQSIDWNGKYSGSIDGTPTTLSLQHELAQISGVMDASGYKYNLSGRVKSNNSTGTLSDSQTGGQLSYSAVLQGSSLTLTLSTYDAYTGQNNSFDLYFTRSGAERSTDQIAGNTDNSTNEKVGGDMRLVGYWTYTDSYTSGEYSFATQYKLQVNSDGTYLFGDGKVAGGGPGISGSSGGGDVTRGKWRAENGIIYINEGSGWQAYAGYYVEGTRMMMKFNDGSKQIWYKN